MLTVLECTVLDQQLDEFWGRFVLQCFLQDPAFCPPLRIDIRTVLQQELGMLESPLRDLLAAALPVSRVGVERRSQPKQGSEAILVGPTPRGILSAEKPHSFLVVHGYCEIKCRVPVEFPGGGIGPALQERFKQVYRAALVGQCEV